MSEATGIIEWRETEPGKLEAVAVLEGGREVKAGWCPQPGSQEAFLKCPAFEVLYEGTRGPGKTDCLIMDFAQHTGPDDRVDKSTPQWRGFGPAWRGILFRQTFPQLADVITKTRKWFPMMFPGIRFNEGKNTWIWPTGETLRLSYGLKESDYWNYHGHEYPWLAFEELTTWHDPGFFKKMMSCCRSTVQGIPRKLRATTNPYGPGHNWVKSRYDLHLPPRGVYGKLIEEEGLPERMSIHGYLDENRILLTADPQYKDRIRAAARNPAELAAWLHGSWDIVAGGMFDDVWDAKQHILFPFPIPKSWRIDRSFDWGSSAPFSVGWWAQSDGSDVRLNNGKVGSTVRGDLIRIAEWYGWNGQPNEGLRMLASEITKGIIEREKRWGLYGSVRPGVADSSIFAVENGMSIAADMAQHVTVDNRSYPGVQWLRADKRPGSRKTGWEMMRKYFKAAIRNGTPRENPGIFVFNTCEQFIRTIPSLPRDLDGDPDNVDTDSEDHIGDEVRYRVRAASTMMRSGTTSGTTS
ncbi:MAG: terminase family protein [Candidatus Sabulitectum sp.]|nr:terminase family protein [Candidatus Sabulitectum sp.]